MSSTSIYKSPLCSCTICKEVKSAKGIHSHYHTAHTEEGHNRITLKHPNADRSKQKQQAKDKRETYRQNPIFCKECKEPLSYNNRAGDFCSRSCSAIYTNRHRKESGWVMSETSRNQISSALTIDYCLVSWCIICGGIIKYSNNKVCSDVCRSVIFRENGIKGKQVQPKQTEDENWNRRYSLHCFYNDPPLTFDEFKTIKLEEESRPKRTPKMPKTHTNLCIVCGSPTNSGRKTCSDDCLYKSREWNCGKAKKFPVVDSDGKPCTLGSPWEMQIYEYLVNNQITWIRPKPYSYFSPSRNKLAKYFGDFYLPDYDLWVDPKNSYVKTLQEEKLSILSKELNLVYGSVQKCIDVIKDKIGRDTQIRTETNR